MNYEERSQVWVSEKFRAQCRMALMDWLNYWATTGTGSITDEDLREKTDQFISFAIHNPDHYAEALSVLVIGESAVTVKEDPEDEDVRAAVTHVLSTALAYLL